MTGKRELICPECGRNYGKPVELSITTDDFNGTYALVCVECECGATWSTQNGGRCLNEGD